MAWCWTRWASRVRLRRSSFRRGVALQPGTGAIVDKVTEMVGLRAVQVPHRFVATRRQACSWDRNTDYVPRKEPADFLSGGKVVKIDSLVLKVMPDGSNGCSGTGPGAKWTICNTPPFDLIPQMEKNPALHVQSFTGEQMFHGLVSGEPRDQAVRRPGKSAGCCGKLVDQHEVLQALGIDPKIHRAVLPLVSGCATRRCKSSTGSEIAAHPSVEAAREALKHTKIRWREGRRVAGHRYRGH